MSPLRSARWTIASGLTLALTLSLFIDLAILIVPIYDMQLYDRVLMSKNMDTLAMLSVACVVGLTFYGLLDFLRSSAFVAISEIIGRRLNGPALDAGIRRAAEGDKRIGPQLVRDVNEMQTLLGSGAIAVPMDALCTPLFVAVLFILHPAFGFLAVVGISSIILAGAAAELCVHPALHEAQDPRRSADHFLTRGLTQTELTEGLGMLPAIARRWSERRAQSLHVLNNATRRAQLLSGISRTTRLALQAGVMALGAVLIIRGSTTPGSLMGANLLLNKCLGPFDHLVESCKSWISARGAWHRIGNLLLAEIASTAPVKNSRHEPGLACNNVSLILPDGRSVLQEIAFTLTPGTFAVITGPNGGGKTSLLRVLAGAVKPTCGTILLDAMPLRGGSDIGYLPQYVGLMDGTIVDNIGRLNPDLGETLAAARQAGVHNAIGRLSLGYETELTCDGSALSGGMRQSIGLARAIYGSPRLLLLDEPDASLDVQGRKDLLAAIRASCKTGTITIAISHRREMYDAADLVLEIKDGKSRLKSVRQAEAAGPKLQMA